MNNSISINEQGIHRHQTPLCYCSSAGYSRNS